MTEIKKSVFVVAEVAKFAFFFNYILLIIIIIFASCAGESALSGRFSP